MISNRENPWVKMAKKKEADEALIFAKTAMVKKARTLLQNDDFQEYRKLYEDYHAREMENIMILNEKDPVKYAFEIRDVVSTLKAYRLLISSIEEDASIQVQGDQQ